MSDVHDVSPLVVELLALEHDPRPQAVGDEDKEDNRMLGEVRLIPLLCLLGFPGTVRDIVAKSAVLSVVLAPPLGQDPSG